MKLGQSSALKTEADIFQAAECVESGFEPVQYSISRKGNAALAKDDAGRVIIIKRHGNQFAGRILASSAKAREEVDALVVDCGENWFGPVRLHIDDASIWADRINRL